MHKKATKIESSKVQVLKQTKSFSGLELIENKTSYGLLEVQEETKKTKKKGNNYNNTLVHCQVVLGLYTGHEYSGVNCYQFRTAAL